MKAAVIAVLILATVGLGQALKCYVCSSSESWDKCENKETDCGAAADRCMSMEMQYKVGSLETKSFARTCSTKASCDVVDTTMKACKDVKDSTCKASCCEKDLCNAGAAPVVSGILILSCAVLALFQ